MATKNSSPLLFHVIALTCDAVMGHRATVMHAYLNWELLDGQHLLEAHVKERHLVLLQQVAIKYSHNPHDDQATLFPAAR